MTFLVNTELVDCFENQKLIERRCATAAQAKLRPAYRMLLREESYDCGPSRLLCFRAHWTFQLTMVAVTCGKLNHHLAFNICKKEPDRKAT